MYFKDTNNNLHFLDSDEFINLLPSDCVKITDEEAEAIRVSQLPIIDPQIAINQEALDYLVSTDWIVTKISECQLLNGDVEALKTKYAIELLTRSEKRAKIV
jgi:hypothetical protein